MRISQRRTFFTGELDPDSPEATSQETGHVAARVLNQLFRSHLHPQEPREYTHKEIEEGIAKKYGRKIIDASYISKLRNGHIQSPSLAAIEAICVHFDVDPLIFFPRLADLREQKKPQSGEEHRILVAFRKLESSPQLFRRVTDLVTDLADQMQTGEEGDDTEHKF